MSENDNTEFKLGGVCPHAFVIREGGSIVDFSLTSEQRDIKRAAREFAEGEFTAEKAIELELSHQFPRDLYQKAAELGFIGLDYSEEIGGGGLGVTENVLVVEEFCKADSGIGMAIHLREPGSTGEISRAVDSRRVRFGCVFYGA